MKRMKIKDTRIRNNKMFQEDQGIFYRKTQRTKQLNGKVPKKWENVKSSGQESGKTTPKPHNGNR